mgnify:FL=1
MWASRTESYERGDALRAGLLAVLIDLAARLHDMHMHELNIVIAVDHLMAALWGACWLGFGAAVIS